MNAPQAIIITRKIEQNLELYDTFFEHAWADALTKRAPAQLTDAVSNLCLSWKEAANTHRLPWLMIQQMEAFSVAFMRRSKPEMAELTGRIRDWLFREMNGKLQRVEKKAIDAVLKKMDRGLRLASVEKDARFPANEYWNDIVKQSEMVFSIAGSQNLAYCALVFGYEWFLVSCFRALGGSEKLKPNQDKFWERFEQLMGRDVKPDYWDARPVRIARHARNSIAHLGGKAKSELVDEKSDLFVGPEGFISVRPTNNRVLYAALKRKVGQLVDEVAPILASPAAESKPV
jgi:hypothetical protein